MPVRTGNRAGFETFVISTSQASAEVCPARGGLVTRFSIAGDELLYLDEETFEDLSKNVRGGIPILFPVAGPPPPGSKLKQHGFARNSVWAASATDDAVRLTLEPSDTNRSLFPFEFRLELTVELVGMRLELRWLVHNRDEKPMPMHFGLHPYFRVAGDKKERVLIETEATKAFDNVTKQHVEHPRIAFGGAEVDLHLLDHHAQGTVLHRGDGTKVPLNWSHSFNTLVLWTLPGQPFVCVEPWSAPSVPAGGGPALLPAGGSSSFAFTVGR
jgi:galactose mutarotase-like enzyme